MVPQTTLSSVGGFFVGFFLVLFFAFGSVHFFTRFPLRQIGGVTGQSIEVSRDYASCLCLMSKVSTLPREWDAGPVSHREYCSVQKKKKIPVPGESALQTCSYTRIRGEKMVILTHLDRTLAPKKEKDFSMILSLPISLNIVLRHPVVDQFSTFSGVQRNLAEL